MNTQKKRLTYSLIMMTLFSGSIVAQEVMSLSGNWDFQIDRENIGEKNKLFIKEMNDEIELPGSMPQRLKGDMLSVETVWTGSLYDSSYFYNPYMEKYRKADNFKLPFFLTPDRHYVGAAWYRKDIEIPKSWKNKRITLFLERAHIETSLWVNGKKAGEDNSLCVPHIYDITDYVKTGKNSIAIKIDNNIDGVCVGADSHSVTDQTQGNWNGIVGRIELQASPLLYTEDLQIYPDIHKKEALVRITVRNEKGKKNDKATIRLSAKSFNTDKEHIIPQIEKEVSLDNGEATVEMTLPMGNDMLLWDEFSPALYELRAEVESKYGTDVQTRSFGMREFSIKGKMFYVNGRETMLRGTVENCDFPITGYAPMDEESWERVFRICRNYGLNHMRFHSFCPPEAAFKAADKVGFYLQPEGPSWPNHGVKLGNGMPIDEYLMSETQRINKMYGNYASFCMLACGNEPAGNWVAWVSDFVDYWKKTDSRHVYTGASVGGGWAWQPKSMYHAKAGVRGLDEWRRRAPESTFDFRAKLDTVRQPYVSHETGQWCVFPNFDEISKYTGVNKARNFEIFRDLLNDNHMGDMAHKFVMASGKLQALCYKHELERTLRTPDYAGFQMLALNDYSGQGTALVGLTDVFFDEKEYISPEEFREFCSPTVLLARIPKFTYWDDEEFSADIEIAHYGEAPIKNAKIKYYIKDQYGKVFYKGEFDNKEIPLGNNIEIGKITYKNTFNKAIKLTLETVLEGYAENSSKRTDNSDIKTDDSNRTDDSVKRIESKNHWDFWVYPKSTLQDIANVPEDIYIADSLDDKAKEILDKGGKVLITAGGKISYGKDIVQQFVPVFWNTSWFKMRPPHTTGLYIENAHPLFRNFPTDYHSDLQWWDLVNKKQVMQFTEFPDDFQPIVQSIDTWFLSRKIGMLFEANVGNGKLMMTTMPLEADSRYPVIAQMRKAVIEYMDSDMFRPKYDIDIQTVSNLFTKEAPKVNMFTNDSPDELKPKLK